MSKPHDCTPAALYARGPSVAAQMRALREYLEKNGCLVALETVDEAQGGRIGKSAGGPILDREAVEAWWYFKVL